MFWCSSFGVRLSKARNAKRQTDKRVVKEEMINHKLILDSFTSFSGFSPTHLCVCLRCFSILLARLRFPGWMLRQSVVINRKLQAYEFLAMLQAKCWKWFRGANTVQQVAQETKANNQSLIKNAWHVWYEAARAKINYHCISTWRKLIRANEKDKYLINSINCLWLLL